MTKLEEIARALAARRGMTAWEALDESDRVGFRLDAVAAIGAMREPTEVMLGRHHRPTANVLWGCMIEAALSEEQ